MPNGYWAMHGAPFGHGPSMRSLMGMMMGSMGGYDDFQPDRSMWADKSNAALRRENEAKQAFEAHRKEAEAHGYSTPTSFELLPPSKHLTGDCFKDFRNFVKRYPGWSATRREATQEERAQHKVTRKSAAYFTVVKFEPAKCPSAAKPKKAVPPEQAASKQGAAAAPMKQPLAAQPANVQPSAEKAQKRKVDPRDIEDDDWAPKNKKKTTGKYWSP